MRWLLLWTGIGVLNLAMLASCGWMLWRKGRALFAELSVQGRSVEELLATIQRRI